jgi:cyclophilin family peptidyl-prolyl cis-trans isomerase/HEAT repeat protein
MRALIISICLLLTCAACQKQDLVFDQTFIAVADLQDKRAVDALIPYLHHNQASVRQHGAMAFASIQDSSAVEALGEVLIHDVNENVRKAAAYALGQTNTRQSFSTLQNAFALEKNADVKETIATALGKTANHFEDVLSYHDSLQEISWMYYFAGNRNPAPPIATDQILSKWEQRATQQRLGAAHFLARGATLHTQHLQRLEQILSQEQNAEVRMAITSSLRKIQYDSSLTILKKIATTDSDYRVRINAVYALRSFPFEKTKEVLIQLLSDEQLNVVTAASEVLLSKATKDTLQDIEKNIAGKSFRVQGNLYEALYKADQGDRIKNIIIEKFNKTDSPYAKAAYLKALQHGFTTYEFLHQVLLQTDTPVVRITAAMALVNIQKQKDFPLQLNAPFNTIIKEAMQLKDAAVVGLFAELLTDTSLHFQNRFTDFSFLKEARATLSLPKDMEAIQPLEKALQMFEGTPIVEPKNEFNHPIDWELLSNTTQTKARIQTTKGDIVIQLFPKEAPGSVANFISLTKANYFDQKFFHRVVPNFVVQAGCNRGDGWGSEDYSIRSEFSGRRYKEGSVGMASAGKDTEGTQWFITHSPTPHLEGRYTIFAEVISGMEVVHQIDVGDQILTVTLE